MPGSTHPASFVPPLHAHSGKLLVLTELSLSRNCSPIRDLVLLHFAESSLVSEGKRPALSEPLCSISGEMLMGTVWRGRAKPVLPPLLSQPSFQHLICVINPQSFCSAFKLTLKRLCCFFPALKTDPRRQVSWFEHQTHTQRTATPKQIVSHNVHFTAKHYKELS